MLQEWENQIRQDFSEPNRPQFCDRNGMYPLMSDPSVLTPICLVNIS
jgi:hypothetical protein